MSSSTTLKMSHRLQSMDFSASSAANGLSRSCSIYFIYSLTSYLFVFPVRLLLQVVWTRCNDKAAGGMFLCVRGRMKRTRDRPVCGMLSVRAKALSGLAQAMEVGVRVCPGGAVPVHDQDKEKHNSSSPPSESHLVRHLSAMFGSPQPQTNSALTTPAHTAPPSSLSFTSLPQLPSDFKSKPNPNQGGQQPPDRYGHTSLLCSALT